MPFFDSHYFKTFGGKNNPPVIFLHGFLGNGRDWAEIIEQLKSKYYCITIDLPGHGKSIEVKEQRYEFLTFTNVIVTIAEELAIEKFNLVGYSMGGRVALAAAIYYPERIDKLIIESASPGLKTESERNERIKNDKHLAEKILNTPLEKFLNEWYNQPLFESLKKNTATYEKLKRKRQVNDINGLALSLKHMGSGSQPSYWEKLVNLSAQTLLIVGGLDSKFERITDEMCELNSRFIKKVIADTGHITHFEKPGEFADILKNFLK